MSLLTTTVSRAIVAVRARQKGGELTRRRILLLLHRLTNSAAATTSRFGMLRLRLMRCRG